MPSYSCILTIITLYVDFYQINTVFLVMALVALGRNKKQKVKALDQDKSTKQAT